MAGQQKKTHSPPLPLQHLLNHKTDNHNTNLPNDMPVSNKNRPVQKITPSIPTLLYYTRFWNTNSVPVSDLYQYNCFKLTTQYHVPIFLIAQSKNPQRSPLRLRFLLRTLRKIFYVNGAVIQKQLYQPANTADLLLSAPPTNQTLPPVLLPLLLQQTLYLP